MNNILRFDLNIFAIVLLIALLLVIFSKHQSNDINNKLFIHIVIMTILMLTFEILSWIFDGIENDVYRFLNILFNFCFTAFSVVVVSLWASYIDYHIFKDVNRLKKRGFYSPPAILLIILTIINLFVPFMFEVSAENVYSRLPYIWISISLTVLIYIYVASMIIRKRKVITNKVIYGVMLFLTLPIIGAILQLLYFGLLLIWPATAVALIFSYLIFETTSSTTDFLTGASTRSTAEYTINRYLSRNRSFTVVMMDVDDFKVINDTHGHSAGDEVLIEITAILKKVFGNKAVVARFGGDEFLVVYEGVDKGKINFVRKEVNRLLKLSKKEHVQNTNISMGFDFCSDLTSCSVDEVITDADNDMYLDKARNKNYKRRKSD